MNWFNRTMDKLFWMSDTFANIFGLLALISLGGLILLLLIRGIYIAAHPDQSTQVELSMSQWECTRQEKTWGGKSYYDVCTRWDHR